MNYIHTYDSIQVEVKHILQYCLPFRYRPCMLIFLKKHQYMCTFVMFVSKKIEAENCMLPFFILFLSQELYVKTK